MSRTIPQVADRPRWFGILCIAVAACFSFLVAYPVVRLVIWTLFPDGQFRGDAIVALLKAPWLYGVFFSTTVLCLVSALFSVIIGAVMAWLNERTDANFGAVGTILPIIPLLIPSIALSIGWVFVAAPDVGFFNAWVAKPLGFQVNIYSWTGLIAIYALNGVPYAYLVVAAALKNLDSSLEEASQISGGSLMRTLLSISIPAIKPAIAAAFLIVTIVNVSIYSIPAIIAVTAGIDLLPTRIVIMASKEYPPKIVEAQVLSVGMMMVVTFLWLLQNKISSGRNFVTLGGKSTTSTRLPLGGWKWLARAIVGAFIFTSCIVPGLALLLVSFQPFWTPYVALGGLSLHNYTSVVFENSVTAQALTNSLLLSAGGATAGIVVVSLITLYLVKRTGALATAVDFVVKIPAVIPHLVMALAFLVAFSGPPFSLSGSVTILLIAYVVIYIPPGAIAAGASILQVGRDLSEASAISGASEARTAWKVILPLALPGILAGWAIVFVHMMGDVSGAAILAGIGNPVIGFAVLEIWETGSFGSLAALSMILCLINVAVISLVSVIGSRYSRK